MSLIPWGRSTPIHIERSRHPFSTLQNELDKVMQGLPNFFETPFSSKTHCEGLFLCPAVNVVEDKETFKAEFEMPGMDETDIKVTVANGVLTVKGEKEVSSKNGDKNYTLREIRYGSYERSMQLPEYVDADKAAATFKKGMLWVTLPKKDKNAKSERDLKIEKG